MDPLISGAIVSGVGSLLGGALKSITGNKSQSREYARQKEFAQNAISWKVADAERAGLHPLAAIGANTTSYTPQSVYSDDYGLSDMGQSIGNFISKYQSPAERARRAYVDKTTDLLKLENMRLQNEQIRSDIARTNAEASEISLRNQPGNPKVLPSVGTNTTVFGRVEHKPSEQISTLSPDKPHIEAGLASEIKFVRLPNGHVLPTPSQDVQDYMSDSFLAQAQHQIRLMFMKGYKPPKSWLPDGYDDWTYSIVSGTFVPVKSFKFPQKRKSNISSFYYDSRFNSHQ